MLCYFELVILVQWTKDDRAESRIRKKFCFLKNDMNVLLLVQKLW